MGCGYFPVVTCPGCGKRLRERMAKLELVRNGCGSRFEFAEFGWNHVGGVDTSVRKP